MANDIAYLCQMLKEDFLFKAAWREQKRIEYPHDIRNNDAQKNLSHLAETVDELSDEEVEYFYDEMEFANFDGDAAEEWNEMLRQVGFHRAPDHAREMLHELINWALEQDTTDAT